MSGSAPCGGPTVDKERGQHSFLRMEELMKRESDFRAMSEAVQNWYRFYEVQPNDQSSHVLCTAAINLYNEGYRTVDDIAAALIVTYAGIWSTKVNAPTSSSIH